MDRRTLLKSIAGAFPFIAALKNRAEGGVISNYGSLGLNQHYGIYQTMGILCPLETLGQTGCWGRFGTFYANSTSGSWNVWPAANRAFFFPVYTDSDITINDLRYITGGASSGNVDMGVYDQTQARVVSLGGAAASGTGGGWSAYSITATKLIRGFYWLALAFDNTTQQVPTVAPGNTGGISSMFFIGQQNTAYPLPANATIAAYSSGNVPILGIGATIATA